MFKKTLTASVLSLMFSTAVNADELTVVGFGGSLQKAQSQAYFKPFQKVTGTKLVEDTYSGGVAKIRSMVETGNVVWDVVQMDENEMVLACEEGLLEIIPTSSYGEPNNFLDQARHDCGMGFFVWSLILGFDADKVSKAPTSWSDMWDTKTWPGKRGLRKQARMTLEIALLADGVKPADLYKTLSDPDGVDRAFAKLDKIKNDIVWWESGAQAPEWLASGDVILSAAYNGRIANANKEGRNFGMSWTNQLYAMDFWTVIKGGNVNAAKQFVSYAMEPKSQKAFTDAIPYGVTNLKANELIDKKIAPQLPTNPKNLEGALALSTAFWVDNEEHLQARFTQWLAN